MENRLVALAKCAKRAAAAAFSRLAFRLEASRGFARDKKRFMLGAGALHLRRREAERSEIVMAYHVIEKGLTMPKRHLEFGRGAVAHLANLLERYAARYGADTLVGADAQVSHAASVLAAYAALHAAAGHSVPPTLEVFLGSHPDIAPAKEPHVSREEFFAHSDAPALPAFRLFAPRLPPFRAGRAAAEGKNRRRRAPRTDRSQRLQPPVRPRPRRPRCVTAKETSGASGRFARLRV